MAASGPLRNPGDHIRPDRPAKHNMPAIVGAWPYVQCILYIYSVSSRRGRGHCCVGMQVSVYPTCKHWGIAMTISPLAALSSHPTWCGAALERNGNKRDDMGEMRVHVFLAMFLPDL